MPTYLECKIQKGECKVKYKNKATGNHVIIPFGVTEIMDNGFKNCRNIEEVDIPLTITKISQSAFENCENLKQINLHENIKSISKCAFSNCKNLENLSFNEGLETIDNCAFSNCKSLTKIILPSTIRRIGEDSFKGCSNLSELTILSESIRYGKEAFYDCSSISKIEICTDDFERNVYSKIFNLQYVPNITISSLSKKKDNETSQIENEVESEKSKYKKEIIKFFSSKTDILINHNIDLNNLENQTDEDSITVLLTSNDCDFKWIFNLNTKEDNVSLNNNIFNFKSSTLEEKFDEVLNYFKKTTDTDTSVKNLLKTIEENKNDESTKYAALNELDDIDDSNEHDLEINKALETYSKDKKEALINELQSNIKRSIFISDDVKDNFNKYSDLKDSINEIIDKMISSSTTELFNYFVNKKRLVYLGNLLKIRIENGSKHRLLFCFGIKIKDGRKDDIYLYGYDTEHKDFNKYKSCDPNSISYTIYKYPFSLDKTQKRISEQLNQPLICLGCAGSGKTLISANMYSNIASDKFSNSRQIDKEKLLYLTYNEHTLNSAKNLIRSLTASVINASSITDFFKNIIQVNSTIVDEDDFYSWWNTYIENLNLTNHNKDKEIQTFKTKYSSHFVYVLFRGIYKGSLVNWNKENIKRNNLTDEDFKNECKNQESLISDKEINTLIFIFKQYQNYLKENNKIDDNDLARLVSNRINKNTTYERLIIDEVQDLTERQLEAIISCSKEYKIYLFGDQNQSINPTILDVNKIEGCFKSINKKINKSDEMKRSYRFTPRLATYINHLNTLRDKKIGSTGVNNIESSAIEEDNQKHKAGYCLDKELSFSFLEEAIRTPNSRIIVDNEETKNELVKSLGENSETRILTIFESKGLEWDYVILYHMLSDNQKSVLEILQNNARKSTLHRMIFNEFYVGCTRAKYSFVILEDENIDLEIKNSFLIDPISKITSEKEIKFYLGNNNTSEDWFKEAIKDFSNEQYKSAKADFNNSNNIEKDEWIELCDIMLYKKYTLENAQKMKKRQETLPQAIKIYDNLHNINQVNLLKSRLQEKILTTQELDSIFKEEKLTELEKQYIFENYKDYYDNKMNEMTDKFKRIKERIDNLK